MNEEQGQEIILDNEDCALVIKKDMTTELIIPKFDDDRTITWEENQNMFVIIAIAASMSDPEFTKIITKKMDELMSEQTACGGEEAPACGSCCGCGPKDGD